MSAVLLTQCLQNDFVKPLASGEPLPNQLHIGHAESQRLVGESISDGPIGQFMQWADAQPESQLTTIHIRDWHNADDPAQAAHLQQFNPHCLQNSVGAEFIFPVTNPNAHLVNSTTLNDFASTRLPQLMEGIVSQHGEAPLKVGIIGVWTEAKVQYLAYDILARYPNCQVAVCSALTASSSRSQHFMALQQLRRILGVTVIESIGEFVEFLGGNVQSTGVAGLNQNLAINMAEGQLSEEMDQLTRYLFRDCQQVTLNLLDGGFSGNLVAGVESIDMHGHEQAPHVLKIGPRDLMAKERTSFEQIENVLGNSAPAIAEYADAENLGAIKYRYASMGDGKAQALQGFIQKGGSVEKINRYLSDVFVNQLGRLYRASTVDKLDLFDYYCFDAQWADSVKAKLEELLGTLPDAAQINFPGGMSAPNLYRFYQEQLGQLKSPLGDYPMAFIHGDLNGANVILDSNENVWLIDFFHTHKGHVFKDFAKFENDLLYICTSVNDQAELELAYQFSSFLVNQEKPFSLEDELPSELRNTSFERSYQVIQHIRHLAGRYATTDQTSNQLQWLVALMRYAVHTIGFDEPNELQRIWAAYTSCLIAEKLTAMLRD